MSDAIAYFIFSLALGMLGFTAFHEARRQQTWSRKNRGLVVLTPLGALLCLLFAVQHLRGAPNSLEGFDWVLIIAFLALVAWGFIAELRQPLS